jgi:hypothetical protein
MRHMLRFLHALDPDLYLDLHVTDGADYAYDITWGFNGPHGWSPAISTWLSTKLRPGVDTMLDQMGHIPGPLIFTVDQLDVSQGMYSWTAGPRFSNGYGDARHIPTILLENHSLKPYRQRVLGTYVFLEACIRGVSSDPAGLRAAISADREARPEQVHLGYENGEPGEINFLAVGEEPWDSPVSGAPVMAWNGQVRELAIPVLNNSKPAMFVERPTAWWSPAAWADFGELLSLHAIEFERIDTPRTVEVELAYLPDVDIAEEAYEGHVRVIPGAAENRTGPVEFAAGSLRVPSDQAGGTLAALLLEPGSEDSFFQWGMMLEVLQLTEYFEAYVIAPMARRMMEEDPALAAEFTERLATDQEFAADPVSRMEFFYERTPYFDRQWKLYPIGRER